MDEHEKDAGADDHIEKVRRRAHAIWLDQGMVHGRDEEHWHEAEQLFKQPKPKAPPTVSEYEREQKALRDNFERLKQQRREREAVASK